MASEEPELGYKEVDSSGEFEKANYNSRLAKGKCCFCIPCLGSRRSKNGGSSVWCEKEERWWTRGVKAVKKLREWSEIVAGPRWKTFIRRFNRNRSSGGGSRHAQFQYDPLSYALNFDEGPGGLNANSEDDDASYAYPDFSSRFASIPISAKSSMDLGKDGPNVFT